MGGSVDCLICGRPTKSNHHPFCTVKCEKKWNLKTAAEKINNLPDYPDYNEVMDLNWERWICTADWHNPFLCKKVFMDMIGEATKRKITNLLIAGDFFDMNNFSKFFNLNKISWVEEKMFAKGVLDVLKGTFKQIAFMVANHELRWLKAFQKGSEGDILDIYHLIGFSKFQNLTLHHKCFVRDWVVIHPDTYRKNPLSYARERSNVYKDKNIVITHAHMQASGKDPSGQYFLVDLGCMMDPNKMEYKNLKETAHYNWNKGFMVVEEDSRPILFYY